MKTTLLFASTFIDKRMKRTRIFMIAFALLLTACSTSPALDPNLPTPTPLPKGLCLNVRDCQKGESCQHPDTYYPCGICMNDPSLNECGGDQPCHNGQKCVSISPPCYCGYNVCIEPCDVAGCPTGEVCTDNGTCQAISCNSSDDCGGAYCINGKCSPEPGYCDSNEPRP